MLSVKSRGLSDISGAANIMPRGSVISQVLSAMSRGSVISQVLPTLCLGAQ